MKLSKLLHPVFYRDFKNVTGPDDLIERHEVSSGIKASICGIRIPMLLAVRLLDTRDRAILESFCE